MLDMKGGREGRSGRARRERERKRAGGRGVHANDSISFSLWPLTSIVTIEIVYCK